MVVCNNCYAQRDSPQQSAVLHGWWSATTAMVLYMVLSGSKTRTKASARAHGLDIASMVMGFPLPGHEARRMLRMLRRLCLTTAGGQPVQSAAEHHRQHPTAADAAVAVRPHLPGPGQGRRGVRPQAGAAPDRHVPRHGARKRAGAGDRCCVWPTCDICSC